MSAQQAQQGTAGVAGMLLSPPTARHWFERCLHRWAEGTGHTTAGVNLVVRMKYGGCADLLD